METSVKDLSAGDVKAIRSSLKTKRVKQPLPIRLFNSKQLLKTIVGKGVGRRLNVDQLKDQALQGLSFDDFGSDYQEGLEVLVDSINTDVSTHAFGRRALTHNIVKTLRQRLILENIYKTYPQLNDRQINNPIFIIGFPRSGTTLLHALMAQDVNHRWMPAWEAFDPIPRGAGIDRDQDPRMLEAKARAEKTMTRIDRETAAKHFVKYNEPDECIQLINTSFKSGIFWWHTGATGYLNWLGGQSFESTYLQHLRFIKLLDAQHSAPRWLLKCPAHLSHVAMIKKVYPTAKFIHIHRDPIKAVASGASLSMSIRENYVSKLKLSQVGGEVSSVNVATINNYLQQRPAIPDEDIIDVHFKDLMRDPLKTVSDIYTGLGFSMGEGVPGAVESYIASNPRNKKGKHTYSLSQFALLEDKEREKYSEYMNRFGVEAESL